MQRCVRQTQSKVHGRACVQRLQQTQVIVGCKVGGIEAARLATGLETGTGEAEVTNENC